MANGRFFVFEGTEGSGKSTQIRLLEQRFIASGLPVITTREPGGTAVGEAVRQILLSDDFSDMHPRTVALLHTAARAEHVCLLIRPALDEGVHVLSDRFYDSTLAYQGGGSGLALDELRMLQRFAVGRTVPDQRILLQTRVETGLNRRFSAGGAMNHIDRAKPEFHERVASTFLLLAGQEQDRWIIVDGEQNAQVVNDNLVLAIAKRYPELHLS